MLVVAAALAASQMTPPEEALARQLRAAIRDDLRSNALIGNGNDLAARWSNAQVEGAYAPQLHIQELLLRGRAAKAPLPIRTLSGKAESRLGGKVALDRLMCRATFRRLGTDAGWRIPRLPPRPEGGHSRITTKSEAIG